MHRAVLHTHMRRAVLYMLRAVLYMHRAVLYRHRAVLYMHRAVLIYMRRAVLYTSKSTNKSFTTTYPAQPGPHVRNQIHMVFRFGLLSNSDTAHDRFY